MRKGVISFAKYLWKHIDRIADRIVNELTEHRVILCWFYALAFLALVFYCAITNKDSQITAIITLGGIAGSVVNVWVIGKHKETIEQMRLGEAGEAGEADDKDTGSA